MTVSEEYFIIYYTRHEPRVFRVGCPRKWHFGIPRNTEVISGTIPAKFRGIPRNFAEFRRNFAKITSEVKKFRGIPCRRNSVDTLSMSMQYACHTVHNSANFEALSRTVQDQSILNVNFFNLNLGDRRFRVGIKNFCVWGSRNSNM
jgi:hypothetical protein